MQQQWDYCTLSLREDLIKYYTVHGTTEHPVEDSGVALARLGEEGWELVAINAAFLAYFKRPKAPDAQA
jgi:hypothetical protein